MAYYEAKLVKHSGGESTYAIVPKGVHPSPEVTVGLLTKYKNTPTEKHPWKAFVGVGENIKYIGAYYPEDGYQAAAMDAVLEAAGIEEGPDEEKTIWNSDGTDGPVLICPPPKGHKS